MEKLEVTGCLIWAEVADESPGWSDILPRNSAWDVMHEQVHCDEAANHQLPKAVAFRIIQIVSIQECSSLTQNLMQNLLLYSLSHFFLLLCYCCLSSVVCISPHPPPQRSPPPSPASTPSWFYPCVLYSCSWKPFPPFPPFIPSHLFSGYYQIVLNLNVYGYILLACLFCWLGSS